jgi:hypothetical protein
LAGFIADFLAPSIARRRADARRALKLTLAYRVVRVSAELVRRDPAAALALVLAAL